VLVISYLANTIRTQIDLSNRLATAALTLGTGDALTEGGGSNENKEKRGGGRGGGDRNKGRQQRGQEA
jgi:translation initiation factor 3 subunit F